MILSQKKSCEGCRASSQFSIEACELGFNNSGKYDKVLGTYLIKPQEPCYKPRTITELYEATRLIQITRQREHATVERKGE